MWPEPDRTARLRLDIDIEIRILDPRLHEWGVPAYQSAMAAAVDLHACLDAPLTLASGSPAVLIPAGFALHIARADLAAVILPRSGAGHHRGLVLGNSAGLVDADYVGPITVSAWNRNSAGAPPILIAPGERIAQMLFVPVVRPSLRTVEAFSLASARGAGGFGSTGA